MFMTTTHMDNPKAFLDPKVNPDSKNKQVGDRHTSHDRKQYLRPQACGPRRYASRWLSTTVSRHSHLIRALTLSLSHPTQPAQPSTAVFSFRTYLPHIPAVVTRNRTVHEYEQVESSKEGVRTLDDDIIWMQYLRLGNILDDYFERFLPDDGAHGLSFSQTRREEEKRDTETTPLATSPSI